MSFRTKSGKILTDEQLDALSEQETKSHVEDQLVSLKGDAWAHAYGITDVIEAIYEAGFVIRLGGQK